MNPKKLRPYILAKKIETEDKNFFCWLNGYYNHLAVSVSLSNAFSKSSMAKYPTDPIRITPYTEEELAERAEIERQKAIAFFNQLEKDFNRNHDKD